MMNLNYVNNNVNFCSTSLDSIHFGHHIKKNKFMLGENFTNLNHGSFGSIPKDICQEQCKFYLEQGCIFYQYHIFIYSFKFQTESHPDRWFRKSYFNYLENSREKLSRMINAQSEDVVLVENASSAINSILRSLGFKVLVIFLLF